MSLRRTLAAVGLLATFGLWLTTGAAAQVRIEVPRVDVPDRRPNPTTGVDMGDLVGGLFALRDGYDRSRRGFICALTYDDRNGNGQRDRGEGPLPGWGFTIADAAGTSVAQGQSNKDGRFCNERPLSPGAYSVRQSSGGGWSNTEPGAPTPDFKPVTLPPDKSITVLFGNCRGEGCARERRDETRAGPGDPTPQSTGKICIEKYNDLNGNGARDTGEPLLPGWQFTLWHYTSGNVDQGTTGADGRWCSALDYAPLTYKAIETAQANWNNTDPIGPAMKWVPVWSNQTTTVAFGNQYVEPPPNGQLCVTKYHDLDADGLHEAGEPVLAGWTFKWHPGAGSGPGTPGVTDVNGGICWTVPAGAYTVKEVVAGGWQSSDPVSYWPSKPAVVVGGQTTNLIFGNYPSPKLRYTKVVTSTAPGGGFPTTGLAPGGLFAISHHCVLGNSSGGSGASLMAGQTAPMAGFTGSRVNSLCTITETLPPGPIAFAACPSGTGHWEAPVITTTPFTLAPGMNEVTVANRFVCDLPPPPVQGDLCVTKYQDLDGDGIRDPGEPLLAGWTFTLSNGATGVTGANGRICWTVPIGGYTVTETMQAGWISSDPGGSTPSKPATVVAGETAKLFFGNRKLLPQPGKVCIVKYHDLNGNGVRDGIEPVIVGWSFTLKNAGGIPIVTVTTAGAGGSVCRNLPAGTYSAHEVVQAGWTNTDPGGSAPQKPFTVTPGQTTNLVFGNRMTPPPAPGRVCIIKYNDLQSDGIQGMGDPALVGWTFNLKTLAGVSVGTITTVANPAANCLSLPPGNYRAEEVTQTGWTNTDPPGPLPNKTFTIASGMTMTLGFGNHQNPPPPLPGEICVEKYNDLDGDGVKDVGEGPLSGWAFVLRNAQGVIIAQGNTGANGRWCAQALLPPGTYTVTETLQAGWTSTDPGGSPPVKTVVVGPNQTVTVPFGNHGALSPAQFSIEKFDDSASGACGPNGLNNPCVFRVRITNIGTAAYSGPASFSDSMRVFNLPPAANSMLLLSVGTAGWSCSATGAPMTCTGPVNLAVGQSVDVAVSFNFSHPVRPTRNCVTLTAPAVLPEVCLTL